MKKIYTHIIYMGHLTSLSPKVEMICLIDVVFVNSSNIYKFQHIVVYTKLPTNKERGCDPLLGLMWSSNPTTLPSSHDQTRTSTQKQTVLNSFVRNPAPSGCDNNTLPAKVVATGHWPPSSFLFPFVFPPIFTCTLIIPCFAWICCFVQATCGPSIVLQDPCFELSALVRKQVQIVVSPETSHILDTWNIASP